MGFSKVISAIAVCLFAVCFAASAAVAPTIVMADKEKWVKKMTELPAGSFASVPPNLHHYAMVKDATVIQIDGIGPDTMTAVKAHKR